MRIRLGVPQDANHDEKEAILNAALEATTRANEAELARGTPSFTQLLEGGRVRWRPEPPGDEHFDLGSTVAKRGWGDCDDLAPMYAAELRNSGVDPEAVAVVRPSAPNRWHALVQRRSGALEDPSLAAGMHSVDGDLPYGGPFWRAMFGDRLALATYPQWPGAAARIDVPSASGLPMAYSLLARGQNARRAIVNGCRGVPLVCGDDAFDEDIARVAGLHDLLVGVPPGEVDDALANDGYVGFLPALAPAALSFGMSAAKKLLPGQGGGGGAPGGGAAPGSTLHCPGGPIIVRF